MRETDFVFVLLPNLGSALRQFRLEARPCSLFLAAMFLREQAEGFLSG